MSAWFSIGVYVWVIVLEYSLRLKDWEGTK
jgi:hypothetical protein